MHSPSGELRSLRSALAGQYSIERELGRGGMGVVFLARDERLDRLVALKVLPSEFAAQGDTRERFLREARTAAQLSHPNIVPVYRADELDGMAFFAMGFVEGETLGDRLRDRGPLGPAESVRILREVAWALAYAHARGIVHRDIKPDNILLERGSGRAVVTDFGIARTTFDPSITQAGHVLGTVHYMSPEQCAGGTLDGRSDLYALGVVGFHALSGQLPFDGDEPQAIIVAHATRTAPRLLDVAPDVPPTLAGVIDRCLQKRPDERFATGEALAEALTKALEDAPSARRSSSSDVLNTDQAAAVWRRAAQLQVEAAARLETRVRDTGIRAETRALPAYDPASAGGEAAANGQGAQLDGFRAHDVEAAAVEAGISQRYVALALAELQRSPTALQRASEAPGLTERVAERLFNLTQRSLTVSRAYRFSPREVLTALGRALQAAPYALELADTIGGHPLDGGVLVFKLPAMGTSDYRWTWTRYGIYVKELRISIAPLAGDPRGCEVTAELDLRDGYAPNVGGLVAGIGAFAAGGGGIMGAIGAKTLGLAGLSLAAPVLAVIGVVGVAGYASAGSFYRYNIRKSAKEVEQALAAVEASIRAIDIFGEAPPSRPRMPAGDDGLFLGM